MLSLSHKATPFHLAPRLHQTYGLIIPTWVANHLSSYAAIRLLLAIASPCPYSLLLCDQCIDVGQITCSYDHFLNDQAGATHIKALGILLKRGFRLLRLELGSQTRPNH
jgi:hypothetical protein